LSQNVTFLKDQDYFKQPYLEKNLQDKETQFKALVPSLEFLQFWCLSQNKHLFLPQLKMILSWSNIWKTNCIWKKT